MALERGAHAVLLVSAVGADPGSRTFYLRTKGEMERDIRALGFDRTHIFRPSMILGDRPERRPLERVLGRLWVGVDRLLPGSLDRYRGISGPDIARAMAAAAGLPGERVAVYHWREMRALLA